MEFIKFEELVGISKVEELDGLLCEKNVCGGKVMCFFSKDGKYVVKEMRKSFNEGKDCMVLDELKEIFGFKKMGMRRIKCDKVVERIDKKIKFWKGNMVIKEKKTASPKRVWNTFSCNGVFDLLCAKLLIYKYTL